MSKRFLAALISFALLLTCGLSGTVLPVSAAGADLLGDGDFEGELSTHWSWSNANYSIIHATGSPITVVEESDGNHCLQLPEQTSGSTYAAYTKYICKAPVAAQKNYRITLRYKGTGLRLYFHTTIFTNGNGWKTLPAANDWTEYTHTFSTREEAISSTSTAIGIGHDKVAGTAYVDDIRLFEVVEPESVAFTQSTITLSAGKQQTLSLAAQPEDAEVSGTVTYTSSNTAAATVDANGVVTAVANGVSYITATVGEFSTTCTVIVEPDYTPVLIGDFEGTLSDNWAWTNASYGIINSSSPMSVVEDGTTGNHCLQIPSNGSNYTRYYKSAPVEGGKTYTLKFRYKGSGLRLYLHTSYCTKGMGVISPATSDEWSTYVHTFTTIDTLSNKNFVFSFGHMAAEGTAYVDDVMISETSPVADLVIDGDFEVDPLSLNWQKFTDATAYVSHVTDPDNAANRCLQITGQKSCNYYAMTNAAASTWYKLTYKAKGDGRVVTDFTYSVAGEYTVSGTDSVTVNGTRLYFSPASETEWQEYSIVFKTAEAINVNFVFYLGCIDSNKSVYYDDVSLTPLGVTQTIDGLLGGSVSVSDGTNSGSVLTGQVDKMLTVTVTPNEGYLMVPGSLRYLTGSGVTQRILNKNTAVFGEGEGNTFAFAMPTDNVRILADFVSTNTQNFAWGTIGTAVRYNTNEEADGVRFLTRVNLTAFDETAEGYTLTYEGENYTVKKLGLLLKRAANANELTLDNWTAYATAAGSERIWGVQVYSSENNTFRLTDYTDGYFDYTIAMTTATPSEAFNECLYTARGYLVLEKDDEETVLYANERTDSVNTVIARLNGELSDDTVEVPDEETPETPSDSTVPEDDMDYSNADLKILSIGNSYSQDAHKYLASLATTQGKTFKCVNLYKSGCALATHYNGWVNNEAIYNYELNGVADYNTFVTLKAVLESDTFDVITLQQASWSSVNYSTYQPYLNNLITVLREKQPTAEIYLQQTWAYGDASSHHTDSPTHTGGSMAAMWEKVEASYASAATETGLSLIPSGQAIQLAQEALNERGLGESIQRDNAHVSYTWGRYLLARVWYQMLTGEVPTVTLDALNSSVTADAALEALVAEAAETAFAEYAADPVEQEVAA